MKNVKPPTSYQSTVKCHASLGIDVEAALDRFQLGLDLLGFVPVFGEPFDGINALIYTARGDKLNATLSALAVAPVFGGAFTGIKVVGKGAGNAKTASKIVRSIDKVDDKYLKKLGIDAHELKKEVLGKKAKIAQYDIYVDKKTKELFVYLKGGKGDGIATGEFIK